MKLRLSLITVLCCCVAAVHALQCYNCTYLINSDSSQDFCREPLDESSSAQVVTCTNGCLKNTRGSELLDRVFDKLNLLEKDYFGLRFLDAQNQTRWLDPVKPISKQIRNGPPYILYFGVKFYLENPCRLKEEVTRYQFFLQLRMDMLQGRLPCSFHAAAELSAYATQSELGDYDPSQHSEGYISEFRFIPNQTEELEEQITQLHKKLKGVAPAKAELNFLERARWLDMYGVDLHPVLGDNNVEFFLGLTPCGVVVYKNKTKMARYYWPRISKVHFKDTEFTLVVQSREGLEDECVFKLSSASACKHLWKCCVEQHAFFRLPQVGDDPAHQRKLSFSKSSFKHTGRTQKEALEAASELNRPEQEVNRAPSRKYSRRLSQTDVSLKNATASEDAVFLDDSLASPNGVLLRLSPQPAHRLPSHHRQSGRDSPTSGMSTRSVPWEDAEQARVGLFTPAGESPVSVRSSASRQHRHRGRSKSPAPPHSHGDRSESESEAAYGSKRRSRRSVGSDAGSDLESRHHHQHRKRRSRSRGVSSGSESEYGRHDDGNRRRRRRSRSRERMVNSEEQWNAVEENRMVRGEMRDGQEVVVKRLRDGYPDSDTSSYHRHHHPHRNHHHHHHYQPEYYPHHHHHNQRRQPGRETNNETVNSLHEQHAHPRTRRKKSGDFSDSNISEHSGRHRSKASSPKNPHRTTRNSDKSEALTVPTGTPPPPYSPSGTSHRRDPMHASKDSPLEHRGEVGSRGATVIRNGDVKDGVYSGYMQTGGGLFGSCHRPEGNQGPQVNVHAHAAGPHRQINGFQHRDRHHHRHPQAEVPRPQQEPSPTWGMEGLHIVHSREDSGLGNENEDGLTDRQTQSSLPRQNGQPPTGIRILRQEENVHRYHSDPMPTGDVTDLRTTLHPAVPNHSGLASQNERNLVEQPNTTTTEMQRYDAGKPQSGEHSTVHVENHPKQTLHNGGPNYPPKLRLPSSKSQLNPSGDGDPNWGTIPNQGTTPNRGTVPKGAHVTVNNNTEKPGHLWSKPLEPRHTFVTSSLVDDRDLRVNGDYSAGKRGDTVEDELPDFPPGYKPNYNRGRDQRYSLTTQEIIRVSVLDGDHRDLQTEL